jgi:hypothetical protein
MDIKPNYPLLMRKFIFAVFFLAITLVSRSQSASIKGTVRDSVENKNLVNTVISLLRKNDSVLVKFARVDKDGHFLLAGLKQGQFILMATHPYLGDYFDNIEIKQDGVTELPNIYMTPKSKLLAEVIVKSGSPIRIKGDTTVYTADSFKVRPGANVEELLRRLPGIQVDKDGKITAMGERVKKVLVDGEEFFGSDPGIATKNLRADAVQEVQVFDKKSDQAEFTGIDDGVKDKTINLKMKQKRGYFGKIDLAGGLKNKYTTNAMINSFQGKRKLAGYGIMSNTGKTNLDWQDAQNYGGGEVDGMSSGVSDDGGMYIMFNSGGDESYWGGRNGIPQNWNAGLHYSNKFNKDKLSFNSGYKFSKVNANGETKTFSETFLPDTSWNTNSTNNYFSSVHKHAFNLTLDANLDSNNSLKWTTKVNNNNTKTASNYYSEALNKAAQFINNSTRNSNNNADKNNITSSILWRHKFKKLSRTLSVNTDLAWNEVKNNGLLYSLNSYYSNGSLSEIDTVDQQNIQNSEGRSITTKLAYTEPLVKDVYLELNYSIGYNHNSNERITNSKSNNGKYENIIDTLSNSFIFNRLVNTPGANIRVNKKKINISFGASVGFSNFTQKNVTDNLENNYNYTNFFPRANFTYKFKSNESVRLNYNGSTTAPTLEQLQPTRVNTDPLNIYIGNPNLKQSFRHNFGGGYNFYNVLKEKNMWSNVNFSTTQNAFVQSSTIDSFGKRTYQTINADGIYNMNLFMEYGFKLKGVKMNLGVGPVVNRNRNVDFINGVKNSTTTSSYGIRLNANRYVEKKFDFYISPSFTWNHSEGSVNKSANADYWQIDGWANANISLPKNFQLNTDANVQIRQKDPRFTQKTNYTTWNAFITKRMLKDNKLEVKFGLYDILNQNKGYQRNFNSYSFTETYYTTLKRFWLLTLTWNISKNGKPASGF